MLTSELIEGFVKKFLLRGFDDAADIPDCHREWWEACCRPNKFVAIAAPRGHAKSTAITHSYTLAKILFRESKFIIILSDSEGQASLFLNNIKKELMENEELRATFWVDGLVKETETDIIIRFKDGHEVRIMAKGSEQKMRGLLWKAQKALLRPDLVIIDDMENDELVMNKDRREKLKKWFSSAVIPILSDKGKIRMVGTILHADSLLESFMPSDRAKTTREEHLRVWSTRPTQWHALKYRAHSPDFKQMLWPAKKSEEAMRALRASYEERGQINEYSQEYLNKPIDESNQHFRRSDFLDMSDEDFEKPMSYYVTMDLAVTEKTSSDYSVFIVAGMDSDGYLHLRHLIRERVDTLEISEILFELVRLYDPVMVCAEKGTIVNSILPNIQKRQEEEQMYFPFELFPSTTDKLHRSQGIRLRARAGKVKADKSADWWENFENELLDFPRGRYDDQVDAFSLLGQAIKKFFEAPTTAEEIEEEYNEEKKNSGLFDEGRSATTGY